MTSKRVLHKNPAGARILLDDWFDKHEGRLKTLCTLERTSRNIDITRENFINLYPYLPYQIDLCIDIVSGLRLRPGAQRHIGGSNRPSSSRPSRCSCTRRPTWQTSLWVAS